MTHAALVDRAAVLQREVRSLKKTISTSRERLHVARAELDALEAHAKRLGLVLYTQVGAGDIHGRPHTDP